MLSTSPGEAGAGCIRTRWSAPSSWPTASSPARDGTRSSESATRSRSRSTRPATAGPRRHAGRHPGALRPPGEAAAVHRGHPPSRGPARRRRRSPTPIRRPGRGGPARRTWASRSQVGACSASAAAAQNAIFLHRFRNRVAALRRAQAGHQPRRPHRRCAPGTRAGSPGEPARDYVHWLRAGLRRDRRRRPDRSGRRSPAHRARRRHSAGASAPGDLRCRRRISTADSTVDRHRPRDADHGRHRAPALRPSGSCRSRRPAWT